MVDGRNLLGLSGETWEAILQRLRVLVGGVLSQSRRTGSLEKSALADVALDIHSLLVDLQLGLCDLGVLVLAVALGGCLCSVSHLSG